MRRKGGRSRGKEREGGGGSVSYMETMLHSL